MDDSDINDIFKDYEYKVTGKKGAPEARREPVRQLEEEDEVKERYRKAESSIKEKKAKDANRSYRAPSSGIGSYEKFAYIAVIAVLVAYIGIDLGFYHGSDTAKEETITAAALNTQSANKTLNKSAESAGNASKVVKGETAGNKTGEKLAEDKKLSGKIMLRLDEIDSEMVDADGDLGQINKVVFTIENGKDKDLNPVVDVYAYDSELDPSWEIKSRGQYKGAVIKHGDKYSGSISLVPKTFKNLDIKKSIRLTLNDTEDGFIKAVNEQVLIE